MNANQPEKSTRDAATRLIAFWAMMHDTMVGALEDRLGRRELRELLYQPLFDAGYRTATEHPANAAGIADKIMGLERDFNLRGRVVERGSERVVREVTECPWANIHPAGCHVFAWWMEGYCQGLNPAFQYRLIQLIPEGAQTCLWSVERAASRKT